MILKGDPLVRKEPYSANMFLQYPRMWIGSSTAGARKMDVRKQGVEMEFAD